MDNCRSLLTKEKEKNYQFQEDIRNINIPTTKRLLDQGGYAAFVFDTVFEDDENIILKSFEKEIVFDIVICYRKDGVLNKLCSDFVDYISNDYSFSTNK